MEDKENKNNVVKISKVEDYDDDDEYNNDDEDDEYNDNDDDDEDADDDDDDCYEIDPISFTRKLTFNDSDDVAVIADKGPVALRDFPHPRHLCANYPFNSTSHESYCNQCFCYICEVAAPCVQWNGKDSHCNADKKP